MKKKGCDYFFLEARVLLFCLFLFFFFFLISSRQFSSGNLCCSVSEHLAAEVPCAF